MNLNSTLVRFKFIDVNDSKSSKNSEMISNSSFNNEPIVYIVRIGDSLNAIADEYKIGVDEIVALNNISNSSLIKIGQKLLLPRNSLNTITTN